MNKHKHFTPAPGNLFPRTGLFLFLLLLLAPLSCSRPDSPLNLLERNNPAGALEESCPLPCYRGITPGETSWEKSLELLRQKAETVEITAEKDLILWEEINGIKGRLIFEQHTAQTISLSYPESTLTVQELVAVTGPPDSLHITLPHPRHAPDPEDPRCDVLRLIFSDLQMEAVLYQRRTGEVLPDHHVERISLAPSRSPRAILTPYYQRDWQGYGFYCIAVEDIFP